MTDRLVLIGMMGAGKTTTAALAGERLGWPFHDSDVEIEARTGISAPTLIAQDEGRFRAEEREAVAALLAMAPPVVISVGGGSVMDESTRDRMRASGTVVWLRADRSTLLERVGGGEGRPLLAADPAAAMQELLAERSAVYEALADHILDVDGLTPDEVADRVAALVMRGSPA